MMSCQPKPKARRCWRACFEAQNLGFLFVTSAHRLPFWADFGTCAYAVANRYQQAFAQYVALPNCAHHFAINWPLWADGGMGFDTEEDNQRYLKSSGQAALATKDGLAMLDKILGHPELSQCLVMAGHQHRIEQILGLAEEEPVVVVEAPAVESPEPQMVTKQSRVELRGLSLEESVQWDLKSLAGKALQMDTAKLLPDANFIDFGFDSISLTLFAKRLSDHFGFTLSPSIFFGFPTLATLSAGLLGKYQDRLESFYQATEQVAAPAPVKTKPAPIAKPAAVVTTTKAGVPEPIAIIGMSGRFPQARNVDEFWQVLEAGQNVVAEIPEERFDYKPYHGDPTKDRSKTNGIWCGAIPGVDEFDPLFFAIAPREAHQIDPRHRLLLQESWSALEDAGFGQARLESDCIGMYVGFEQGDYQILLAQSAADNVTSNHDAILASRLSYMLDLKGPVLAINTACSSGLVAAHQGCVALRNHECDTAMAAAVNLLLTPYAFIGMAQAGMLSDDGKCHTFARGANGMVPGEAVAVMVMKRLKRCQSPRRPNFTLWCKAAASTMTAKPMASPPQVANRKASCCAASTKNTRSMPKTSITS